MSARFWLQIHPDSRSEHTNAQLRSERRRLFSGDVKSQIRSRFTGGIFEPLEIPPTSHFDALKRRKRRAPGAFLNQP